MFYAGTISRNYNFRLLCVIFIWSEVQCQSSDTSKLSVEEQNIADQCFTPKECDPNSIYRTMDGSCNNLNKPWWGSTDTPYVRLLKPDYSDSNNKYRVSVVDGSELPGARLVSSTLLKVNISKPDLKLTRMFLVFGQLIAHDVLQNPQSKGSKCCSDSGDDVVSTAGTCRPIPIPATDPYYSQYGRTCQEYHQSVALNCTKLPPGTLLPLGKTTHYLDCSFLYGNTEEDAKALRLGQGGKLRVQASSGGNGKEYLPTQNVSNCPFARNVCYKNGDVRVNQNLDLAVMETVFMRFHNRLATALAEAVPAYSGDDEKLYQETRRLTIGVFQHITFNEYLKRCLDQYSTPEEALIPLTTGYATGYDPTINPSSLVEFAGAAFRTLHSQIPDYISISAEKSASLEHISYSATLERSGDWLQGSDNAFDSDLQDLMTAHQEQLDIYYTQEITNHLVDFQVPVFNQSVRFGDDLAAMDIQRGRDYGLRPYNDYRKLCGFSTFDSFADIESSYGLPEIAKTLASLYKSPQDIDFYVGSLLEMSAKNGNAPSTLQCIWADAFTRYKFGDRFFYEFGNQPGSFSQNELQFIRKLTLAHIVCAGADNITTIQTWLFNPPDAASNPMTNCDTLLKNIFTTSNLSSIWSK